MTRWGNGKAVNWLRDHIAYEGDDCLIWPFSRARGYGNFGLRGQQHYAHRYMCEIVNGPPPSLRHQAAHSCGNGHNGCVNPKHLSWKTQSDNQLDRRKHGTHNIAEWGKRGKVGKLTGEQVIEIRKLKDTKTHAELAKMFGVGRRNIGAILGNRSWTEPEYWPPSC
jgi:hypothetical protein